MVMAMVKANQQVTAGIHLGHAGDSSEPSTQILETAPKAPQSAIKAPAAPRAMLRKSVTFADRVQDDSQPRALLSVRKRVVPPTDDENVSGSSDQEGATIKGRLNSEIEWDRRIAYRYNGSVSTNYLLADYRTW